MLKHSKIDDQVILYFSGHGFLDEFLDFYFATYDIDLENPQTKGLVHQSSQKLTQDRQLSTSRQENLQFDYQVF